MQPSSYQQAVYDHLSQSDVQPQNLVVEAKAGSGKTSTIIQALNVLPKNKVVLFVAFNKHIAEELSRRVPFNVEVSTLNAFGYRIIRNHGFSSRINDRKVRNILWYQIFREDNFNEFAKTVGAVLKIVSLFKALNITQPTEQDSIDVAERYGIAIQTEYTHQHAIATLRESLKMTQTIDFEDQLLYPLYFNMRVPQYDYIFVDEAQDLNLTQIKLVQAAARGTIVAVGDTNQAIYGFRGADPDAIQTLTTLIQAKTLPLSICYRCAKMIVREAQAIVPDIEEFDKQVEGIVDTITPDKYRNEVRDTDYVLCRTTAPLVQEALAMLRQKRKAIVKGRHIGEALLSLAERVDDLDKYEQEQSERLKNNETALVEMQDQVATLRVLLEAYGQDGLKTGIEELFAETTSGITYCTVHRSKGLEVNRVFLICPELVPHPKCTKEWQKVQETNLHYIAVTRAKQAFYYVQGKLR